MIKNLNIKFLLLLISPLILYNGLVLSRDILAGNLLVVVLSSIPSFLLMYSQSLGIFFFSLSLFIFPLFGDSILDFSSLWFSFVLLFGHKYCFKIKFEKVFLLLLVGGGILVSFLCGVIVTFVKFFDSSIIFSIYDASGFGSLVHYIFENKSPWERGFGVFVEYLNAFILVIALKPFLKDSNNKQAAISGITFGVLFSSLFLLGQILELGDVFFINRSEFFYYVGRYSASFTDPNSFGLMAYIAVCYLLTRNSHPSSFFIKMLAVVFLLEAFYFSGSRTFLLGIILVFFLVLSFVTKREDRKIIIKIILFSFFVLLFLGTPVVNNFLVSKIKAPSVLRVVESLNIEKIEQSSFSRVLYAKLAVSAWSSNVISGVGVGRFLWVQEDVSRQLGIDLKGWRDNANNFYLQVLTESGLLGLFWLFFSFLILFLILIRAFPKKKKLFFSQSLRRRIEQVTPIFLMFSLGFILLTGPHFSFDEVRYFCVLIFALEIPIKRVKIKEWKIFSYVVICLMLFSLLFSYYKSFKLLPKGLYSVEAGGVRWTSKEAVFNLCDPKVKAIRVKPLRQGISFNPLKVKFEFQHTLTSRKEEEEVLLNINDWVDIEIPFSLKEREEGVRVKIRVSSVWSPFSEGLSVDTRGLGVQLDWRSLNCSNRSFIETEISPWARRLFKIENGR